eukprot:gnl/MRDRNA2_/MRDRNA2_25814_c0_seq1.p1 gnl/MRDRNA2_/MRDRNA2_25814_c0~~gnl/MRDRNA2_/MRDRNA2_25814_c0_seq1.p1  ORF type:complete len:179 (+),score=24.69 gnl/MRDRNA2_/MRDRNA2_25814_c0_seq1:194-730(+)
MTRTHTIVSLTHSELLLLRKETVVEVIDEYPKTRPHYDEWQEWAETVEEGGISCEHCGGLGHTVRNCPTINEHLSRINDTGRVLSNLRESIGQKVEELKDVTTVVGKVKSELFRKSKFASKSTRTITRKMTKQITKTFMGSSNGDNSGKLRTRGAVLLTGAGSDGNVAVQQTTSNASS